MPRPVGALGVDEPLVGPLGVLMEAGDIERHRGLDVVPRVAVAAGEPRDHAGLQLQRCQMLAGGAQLVGAEHAREIRQVAHRTGSAAFTP